MEWLWVLLLFMAFSCRVMDMESDEDIVPFLRDKSLSRLVVVSLSVEPTPCPECGQTVYKHSLPRYFNNCQVYE